MHILCKFGHIMHEYIMPCTTRTRTIHVKYVFERPKMLSNTRNCQTTLESLSPLHVVFWGLTIRLFECILPDKLLAA